MRINTNVAALSANRNMAEASGAAGKSIERLSSGLRINRAADDASGLVIAEKLKAQSNGINVAVRNAQDGIGLVQTADGALTEVTNILHRMRDLAMHSANGATTGEARDANQSEFTQLSDELTRISETTSFAGQKLLDGTLNTTLNVSQTGADTDAIDLVVATDFDAAGLGVDNGAIQVDAAGGVAAAETAIIALDTALDDVTGARGDLGALQNRLEHTVSNLSVTGENLAAAESRIRDTDMASEMTQFSKQQILSQASQAMLAQANSSSQGVLQLLRG